MDSRPASVNENTELTLPLRNIVSLVVVTALAVWTYFEVHDRLNRLENAVTIIDMEQEKNSEFRIRWPRGEIGSLPADAEQFLLIRGLTSQIEKIETMIGEGTAPHDQQQELKLKFYAERLAALEAAITGLKDTQVELVHTVHPRGNSDSN